MCKIVEKMSKSAVNCANKCTQAVVWTCLIKTRGSWISIQVVWTCLTKTRGSWTRIQYRLKPGFLDWIAQSKNRKKILAGVLSFNQSTRYWQYIARTDKRKEFVGFSLQVFVKTLLPAARADTEHRIESAEIMKNESADFLGTPLRLGKGTP